VEASCDGRRLLAEGSSEARRRAAPGQHEGGGALGGSCVAAIGSVGRDLDGGRGGWEGFFTKLFGQGGRVSMQKKMLYL
jgi:hypothetical protein